MSLVLPWKRLSLAEICRRILISNVYGVVVIKFCVICEGNERGAGPCEGTALYEGHPAGVAHVRAADVKHTRVSHGRHTNSVKWAVCFIAAALLELVSRFSELQSRAR